jgi:hypothetical protein
MTAGSRYFERAFDVLLPFYVVKICCVLRVLIEKVVEIHKHALDGTPAVEKFDHLGQIAHAEHFHFAHHGGFRSVLLRQDKTLHPFFFRRHCNWQRAAHWLYCPVKRQFADQEVIVEYFFVDQSFGGKNPDGHWQIIRRSLLLDICGGKIDGDALGRKRITAVFYRRPDSVFAFLDGAFG